MSTAEAGQEGGSMTEELVRDWMHRGVITCGPETSIQAVADAMKVHDISALVVVDEAGDAIGVISSTDFVNARFVEPYLKHWRGLTAKHLMNSPVVSVSDATPLAEAAACLRDRKIHRLVVIEKHGTHEKPIGILSMTDLVRKL